jgi:L-amino acid N-acyltransferase YncA
VKGITIRRARKADSKQIIDLLVGLANFERLEPPSEAGRNRILADLFERSRIEVFVAEEKGKVLGYALYFFTYSSFLAKPTLYLEDIFVLEQHRKRGGGVLPLQALRGRSHRAGLREDGVGGPDLEREGDTVLRETGGEEDVGLVCVQA